MAKNNEIIDVSNPSGGDIPPPPAYPETHYRIVPDPKNAEKWCVELRDGPWKGVIYSYGQITFKQPDNPSLPMRLAFEREAIFIPEEIRKSELTDEQGKELIQLLGDILVDILNKNLGKGVEKDGKYFLEIGKLEENDKR